MSEEESKESKQEEKSPEADDAQVVGDVTAHKDAVYVSVQRDQEGNIAVDAVPVGNVTAAEVTTLLEFAIKRYRQKLGI